MDSVKEAAARINLKLAANLAARKRWRFVQGFATKGENMQVLTRIDGQFTELGQVVTLNVPDGAEVAALRLYAAQATVTIYAISDPAQLGTHPRSFQLISGPALPANFIKYIGTFPFGPSKVEAHVIEVQP